jgi:23S rRNA (pseudouridine1915-N3)-methyltransferase
MKICLWSIGKPHETYIQEGVADFTNRLSRYFPVEWKLIAPPKNANVLSAEVLKKEEAKLVMDALQKDDVLILLDERGKQLSSVELSELLQQKANASVKRIIFLIGGAFGVDNVVTERANMSWSLSKLVFPHMLVRLILTEQLYRACTILRNEKYHHT